MAARSNGTAEAPAAGIAELAGMVTTLTRVLARMCVNSSRAQGAARFDQIIVHEMHVATDEEAQRLADWLETHP
jgi:predicted signal transduction protein with EAL and GGDEF domain